MPGWAPAACTRPGAACWGGDADGGRGTPCRYRRLQHPIRCRIGNQGFLLARTTLWQAHSAASPPHPALPHRV